MSTAAPYTAEQYQTILATIAGRCDTLFDLICHAQAGEDGVAEVALEAANIVATTIGAMADDASRPGKGSVIGSHERWNYGPNFADEGKEVQP